MQLSGLDLIVSHIQAIRTQKPICAWGYVWRVNHALLFYLRCSAASSPITNAIYKKGNTLKDVLVLYSMLK